MQGLQSQALSEPGTANYFPAGGNQDYVFAVRKRDDSSFPPDTGATRILPRMFPAAAVDEFAGLGRETQFRSPAAAPRDGIAISSRRNRGPALVGLTPEIYPPVRKDLHFPRFSSTAILMFSDFGRAD